MYVIAEIGINHNGDLQTALDLIKIAKEAGCQCVKFQKRNPDVCVPEEQKSKPRTFKGEEMTYLEYKKRIEFGEEEYDIINKYCNDLNIYWTVSVWDKDSVEFMKRYKDNIPFNVSIKYQDEETEIVNIPTIFIYQIFNFFFFHTVLLSYYAFNHNYTSFLLL